MSRCHDVIESIVSWAPERGCVGWGSLLKKDAYVETNLYAGKVVCRLQQQCHV